MITATLLGLIGVVAGYLIATRSLRPRSSSPSRTWDGVVRALHALPPVPAGTALEPALIYEQLRLEQITGTLDASLPDVTGIADRALAVASRVTGAVHATVEERRRARAEW